MTRPPPTALSAASAAAAPPPLDATAMESDFVIILAALLCALICVVGLIAVVRCTCLRRSPAGGDRLPPLSSAAASRNANKGVKKKVLQSLPKFTYTSSSDGPAATKFAAECTICLAEFAEGDEVRVLPRCGHGFHVACIDTWLGSHSSCPSCRQLLVVDRCQRCGGFPGAGSTAEPGPAEAEQKHREDAELGNRNRDTFLP